MDGLRFDVPDVPTHRLLAALAEGDLGAILPGALPVDQQWAWIEHLLDADADFDLPDATAVARAVVEHIAGVPAETALALAHWAATDWLLLDGYHLGRGVDLLGLAPRRLFAVLYAFVVEHRFEDRAEADRLLFPPRARTAPTEADLAADGATFEAALAMAGTMPGVE